MNNPIDILSLTVEKLKNKRIYQEDIMPDAIKSRHIGEGVRYIRCGLASLRPTSGELAGATYFATDTFVLSIWTGSTWKTTTLA